MPFGPPGKKRKTEDDTGEDELWDDVGGDILLSQVLDSTESNQIKTNVAGAPFKNESDFKTPTIWPQTVTPVADCTRQIGTKEELQKLREELKKRNEEKYAYDGEIKTLRTKLTTLENERCQLKESISKERSEKEKRAIQERNKLEAEMTFLQQEKNTQEEKIISLRRQLKNKDDAIENLQRQVSGQLTISPKRARLGNVSPSRPTRHPKFAHDQPGPSHQMSPGKVGHVEKHDVFPTQQSFLATEGIERGAGETTKTQQPQLMACNPSEAGKEEVEQFAEDTVMPLMCNIPKGAVLGPILVHKITTPLMRPHSKKLSSSFKNGGLWSLLHNQPSSLSPPLSSHGCGPGAKASPALNDKKPKSLDGTLVQNIQQSVSDCRLAVDRLLVNGLSEQPSGICQEGTENYQAISLLPLLQSFIVPQLESMKGKNKSGSPSSSSSSDTTPRSGASTSSCDGDSRVERNALCALDTLQRLCSASSLVAKAVLYSPPTEPDVHQQEFLRKLDHLSQEIVGRLSLLDHVITLVEPITVMHISGNIPIIRKSLQILHSVASVCPVSQLKRFSRLLDENRLVGCLPLVLQLLDKEETLLISATVELLSVLYQSPEILQSGCNGNESCIMNRLITICVSAYEHPSALAKRLCIKEVYHLFAVTLKTSAEHRLKTKCPCVEGMTYCVVTSLAYLFEKLKSSRNRGQTAVSSSPVTTSIFQGLHLLSSPLSDVLQESDVKNPKLYNTCASVLCDSINFLRKVPGLDTSEIDKIVNSLWVKFLDVGIPQEDPS